MSRPEVGAGGAAMDRGGPDVAPRPGPRAWLALAVLAIPTLLVSIDNTVLGFALPAISTGLLAERITSTARSRAAGSGTGRATC